MIPYIAFMRAINVTGRYIKMAELAGHYLSLGQHDVRTFINSGNVLFSSAQAEADALQDDLEQQLEPLLGFRSELFLRTPAQLVDIARQAAQLRDARPAQEVNVLFLKQPLDAAQQQTLAALQTSSDMLQHSGREIYWLSDAMQSQSKLSNAVFERKLRIRATLRRHSMLQQLAEQLASSA
ncbi:DUF1697 domain-containing protein [Chitinimonas sp.]|uniref:DUF1697 domain-containing protein n=1 Tax=Chitinimonas sp. TaxID=1934313 RepID=UPI0035B07D0D